MNHRHCIQISTEWSLHTYQSKENIKYGSLFLTVALKERASGNPAIPFKTMLDNDLAILLETEEPLDKSTDTISRRIISKASSAASSYEKY